MNERGGELYHIIGELLLQSETNLMLQLLQSGKNQLLMQQAIYNFIGYIRMQGMRL